MLWSTLLRIECGLFILCHVRCLISSFGTEIICFMAFLTAKVADAKLTNRVAFFLSLFCPREIPQIRALWPSRELETRPGVDCTDRQRYESVSGAAGICASTSLPLF